MLWILIRSSSAKIYEVGTRKRHLKESLLILISIDNICFKGEIRELLIPFMWSCGVIQRYLIVV